MNGNIVIPGETEHMLDLAENLLQIANKPLEAKSLLVDIVRSSGGNSKDPQQLTTVNSAISQDPRFVPARVLGKATPHSMPPGKWRPSERTQSYSNVGDPTKYRERGQEFHPAWALKQWHLKSEFTQIDEDETESEPKVEKKPKTVRRVRRAKNTKDEGADEEASA